jgi:hypothetical protein
MIDPVPLAAPAVSMTDAIPSSASCATDKIMLKIKIPKATSMNGLTHLKLLVLVLLLLRTSNRIQSCQIFLILSLGSGSEPE